MTPRSDRPRVIVAGSVNYDVVVTAPRHPVVGETLIGIDVNSYPGGKGENQAIAAARAGAEVAIVGCLGADDAGAFLREYLQRAGIVLDHLRVAPAPTGQAFITLANDDVSIIVIPGANSHLEARDVGDVDVRPDDVLVTQFEIPTETVEAFLARGKSLGARTIVNPSPTRATAQSVWESSDIVVVNELEFEWLAEVFSLGAGPQVIHDLRTKVFNGPGRAIVVTRGPLGCVIGDASGTLEIRGHAVNVVDTTGAGDCFLGNLASGLSLGLSLATAAVSANAASAVCVQRMGAATSMPFREETDSLLNQAS